MTALVKVVGTFLAALTLLPVSVSQPWTPAEVASEWEQVREVAPLLPPIGDVLVIQEGAQGLIRYTPGSVTIFLPRQSTWRRTLWHEAGHAHAYWYNVDWGAYYRLRVQPLAGLPLREIYAEDFRRCFSPHRFEERRHVWALRLGEPDFATCLWILSGGAGHD